MQAKSATANQQKMFMYISQILSEEIKKKREKKTFPLSLLFHERFEAAMYWARSYAIFRLFLVYRAIKAKSVAKLRVHRFQRCRKEYEMGENGVYATATPARVRIRVDGTCRLCVLVEREIFVVRFILLSSWCGVLMPF